MVLPSTITPLSSSCRVFTQLCFFNTTSVNGMQTSSISICIQAPTSSATSQLIPSPSSSAVNPVERPNTADRQSAHYLQTIPWSYSNPLRLSLFALVAAISLCSAVEVCFTQPCHLCHCSMNVCTQLCMVWSTSSVQTSSMIMVIHSARPSDRPIWQ